MRTSRKLINLYKDKNVFSIKHVISIDKEEDLNQFWDYLTNTQNSTHNYLHTFVSKFYNFALSYVTQEDARFFEIILEENDEKFYFTLWNEKVSLLFKEYLRGTSIEYLYKENRISVKLLKQTYKENLKKIAKENKKREKNLIKSVSKDVKVKVIPAYDFISHGDLEDLIHLNYQLQDILYLINKTEITDALFMKLRSTFSMFCFTLSYYDEVSPVMVTINNFLYLMNANKEKFLTLNLTEFELIYGFIYNLEKWIKTLFVQGGVDLRFMDNSLMSDYETISHMLTPQVDELAYDMDDIFIF